MNSETLIVESTPDTLVETRSIGDPDAAENCAIGHAVGASKLTVARIPDAIRRC
nr:hypothetical protein [Halovivax gelatinilyticus]